MRPTTTSPAMFHKLYTIPAHADHNPNSNEEPQSMTLTEPRT
jgi:hypothetical protein